METCILIKVTKEKIIEKFTSSCGETRKESERRLCILIETLKESLVEDGEVKITHFGKWQVKTKKPRTGRDPHTGESIEISGRKVISFQPSSRVRRSL